ncbi:MAG: hypothetical protein K2N94_01880, partial [Lachnospiraceae bacterium]|nr:hypothetical protein [Lachnospiraceae bacterium]
AVQNAPNEQCTEILLEYIWTMQRAFVVNQTPEFLHILDILSSIQISDRSGEEYPALIPSQVTINNDASCMLHGISRDMRFALVLPDGGAGYAAMLKKPEEYIRLFTLLAKPHVLDMLIDIDMRSPEEHFTARLAAERLGISPQEAEEILDELSGCLMVNKLEVADASETLGVYQKNEEINLHVFLFFCGQLMHSVETIQCGINLRKKPVFHARPGSGSLTPEWNTKKEEEHLNEA